MTVVEQMGAFDTRWGGLLLPPSPFYEGGPKILRSDMPEISATGDWWFDAGDQRCSMGYAFRISRRGEFVIEDGVNQATLHESIAGWIESLALAHMAAYWAPHIVKIRGAAVDDLNLSDLEPVPEVVGVTDTWWRSGETAIAIYRAEALLFGDPALQRATIYSGIAEAPIYLDF